MLFKYLRPERVDVLERLEIRFTQPGALNDPFELRPRFDSLVSEAETLAHFSATPIDFEPILQQAFAMLPDEYRSRLSYENASQIIKSFMDSDQGRASASTGLVAFLGAMKDGAALLRESIYAALNRNVGILSLTEVADDTLMWAHYADSHRGILIGFDEKHAFFNRRRSEGDEFYFLRSVLYAELPAAPSLAKLEGDAIFVTKGEKWEYEREWRMLAPLTDATRCVETDGDSVYLYSFPADALATIVIGARAASSLETTLGEILGADTSVGHVTVSRALLDHDSQRVKVDIAAP